MKLIFPNGEHEPFIISDESVKIGSATDADLVLVGPGVAMYHTTLAKKGNGFQLVTDNPDKELSVNDEPVLDSHDVKAGDLIKLSGINIRLVAMDNSVVNHDVEEDDTDNDGRTKVRMAIPRFNLRGVSGETFGKNVPLYGTMTIGRHSDCDIVVSSNEVSRRHARIKVSGVTVSIEDMGSANGTFVNGKKVDKAELQDGDELRLDTVRFRLQAPPQLKAKAQMKKQNEQQVKEDSPSSNLIWVALAVIAIAGAGIVYYVVGS